jgi:hypothetical protein
MAKGILLFMLLMSPAWVSSQAAEQPPWSVRDAAAIIETLDIEDRNARDIIKLLLDDYDRAWRQSRLDQKAAVTALDAERLEGDLYLRRSFDTAAAYGLERDTLATEFELGMKAFLDVSHQDAWSALKRATRRRNVLPRGELFGEQTDLRTVIDAMPEGKDTLDVPGVEEHLLTWEYAMDALLADRTRFERTFPTSFRALCMDLEFARALHLAQERLAMQQAVRDLTDETVVNLGHLLSPQQSQSLQDQIDIDEHLAGVPRGVATLYQALLEWKPERAGDGVFRDALLSEWKALRRELLGQLRTTMRRVDGLQKISELKRRLNQSPDWEEQERELFVARFQIREADQRFAQSACDLLGEVDCKRALKGQLNAIRKLLDKPTDSDPFPDLGSIDPNATDPFELNNEPPQGDPFPESDPSKDTPSPFPGFKPDPDAPDPFGPDAPGEPEPQTPDPFPADEFR